MNERDSKSYHEREVHYELIKRGRDGRFMEDGTRRGFGYRNKIFQRYWRMFGDKL